MLRDFDKVEKLAREYVEKLKKEKNLVSIVQIGSSLRKEDFKPNSDLDFLVIYENPVKRAIELKDMENIEVNLIRRGRKQFLSSLKEGNPVDLISLNYGKILYDNGFFVAVKNKKTEFKPGEKTIEKWIHTASFNLMDAAMNYSFPSCMCCYFKALHHAAREFSRAMILKEQGKFIEGEKAILENLSSNYPDLHKKFKFIIDGRENYERFKQKCIKFPKIKNSALGRYLLALEDISIKALKITRELEVPKANNLIMQLQKKYKIEEYHGYYISPESEELMLHLVLKKGKSGFFRYNLRDRKLIDIKIR